LFRNWFLNHFKLPFLAPYTIYLCCSCMGVKFPMGAIEIVLQSATARLYLWLIYVLIVFDIKGQKIGFVKGRKGFRCTVWTQQPFFEAPKLNFIFLNVSFSAYVIIWRICFPTRTFLIELKTFFHCNIGQ